ncbi:hypothetical protein PVL29_022871 [Vitis rotundifolia]|uniref:Uncharacterized protein n=1 Tax=Vitis rotundifolia TaxID=103349 RepID=A0AA38YWV5_VITRO|nr:hypothetical protein PVL29_022871 [Vitis rotundifolia]
MDALMVQVPPFDVVRPELELVACPSVEDICPAKDGTLVATPGGNANDIVALLNCLVTLALIAWFVPPMALWSLYFGVLIRCKSTLPRRWRKCLMLFQGVVAIYNLMRQQSSLLKRLEVTESMQAFLTQQIDNNEELRAQLVWVESELASIRKVVVDAKKLLKELEEGMQVAKVKACWMEEEKEAAEAKCKDAEQERDQLKRELE